MAHWDEQESGSLFLIDTPGINEIDGEARERMAHEVSQRSDLVLFVIDGDMTDSEYSALQGLAREHRPLLLVLNKSDRYTAAQREELRNSLLARLEHIITAREPDRGSCRPATAHLHRGGCRWPGNRERTAPRLPTSRR